MILMTLALCPLAAWLGSRGRRWASLLAAWPAFMTLALGRRFAAALGGEPVHDQLDWIPSLGLSLSFRLDGLSGVFALLITFVGSGIVLYAAHYFHGHVYSGRFQATLFAFMAAMLGVVLTDNVFALFVFWELTGFTSYLLIGFEHEKAEARRAALQALLVTGAGGLGLLAAAVLLSQAAGSTSLQGLAASASLLQRHPMYAASTLCVLFAAFTKSAQFPFQFWLPNAMAAPTPVSAYLHSATMVKAGVYLVARMTPTLGGTALWTTLVVTTGGLTMLGAAVVAVQQTDLKKILAYSTLSALGTLMLLLGLGTPASSAAALTYLVAHACYKGSLFLVAGVIDHETGTRDITQLSGLRHCMPISAGVGALAAASMLGLPPLLGFLGKEQAYAAVLHHPPLLAVGLVSALVLANALLGASGLLVGVAPFIGPRRLPATAHEAPLGLWLTPSVLAALGLSGALAAWLGLPLAFATQSIIGRPFALQLSLWHGFNLPLALSAVTLGLSAVAYASRARLRRLEWPRAFSSERLYDAALQANQALSARLAPALQDASLASYVLSFVVTTGVLIGTALYLTSGIPVPERMLSVQVHEGLVALVIIAAALTAVRARTTMTAVLALGAAGYGVAFTFLLFGAPDLAMTQFAVETLTAVIFVFVFWQLPRTEEKTSSRARRRDALVAIAFGGLVSVLTLAAATHPTNSRLRDFYAAAAPTLAHGRNIVNVLLVDFRALDTLGEITVLVTAALGVSALLRIASETRAAELRAAEMETTEADASRAEPNQLSASELGDLQAAAERKQER
jgi:multicomponent Na+:H+ antiporter subunit A